jgi:hypothetical protein
VVQAGGASPDVENWMAREGRELAIRGPPAELREVIGRHHVPSSMSRWRKDEAMSELRASERLTEPKQKERPTGSRFSGA